MNCLVIRLMEYTMSFNAYYYSFEPTGNKEVDSILEAVARAGKAFHNTDEWSEKHDWHNSGVSMEELIQNTANEAARKLAL